MRKILICTFFLGLASGGSALAQKNGLSKMVEEIRTTIIANYKASGKEVTEKFALPVFVNYESIGRDNYEALDKYSLDDVKETTISFDSRNTAIYGTMGTYGVIHIQLIEKKE